MSYEQDKFKEKFFVSHMTNAAMGHRLHLGDIGTIEMVDGKPTLVLDEGVQDKIDDAMDLRKHVPEGTPAVGLAEAHRFFLLNSDGLLDISIKAHDDDQYVIINLNVEKLAKLMNVEVQKENLKKAGFL